MKDATPLGLQMQLEALGVAAHRHGRFIGLRGRYVGRVPDAVWRAPDTHEPALLRLLPDSPTPYEQRRAGP
jgi:hypothetical protein